MGSGVVGVSRVKSPTSSTEQVVESPTGDVENQTGANIMQSFTGCCSSQQAKVNFIAHRWFVGWQGLPSHGN